MRYYNEECKPLCLLDDKTKQAIRESDNIQAMALDGKFYRVAVSTVLYVGKIYRAPMPAEKKRIPLESCDIKQGDAIKSHNRSDDFFAMIILKSNNHIETCSENFTYYQLMERGYKIRSIGETEWREFSKEVPL